jgi:sodium/hydrogen antiporter
VLGAVIGFVFCHLMKYTHKKSFINRESYVAQYIALTFFTIGICSTLGSDDLLGAFAAGMQPSCQDDNASHKAIGSAIAWDGHFGTQVHGEIFATVIDLVLNCACFIYIGAWLPFNSYHLPELSIYFWKLVVLLIAVIALRRIPVLLLIYKTVPEIASWREALFSGHFGP